jgi:hypothetical protein
MGRNPDGTEDEVNDEKDQLKNEIDVLSKQIANDQKTLDDLRNRLAKILCPFKIGQRIVNTTSRKKKVIWEIVDILHNKYDSYDFELACRRITKNGLSKFINVITIYSCDRYEVVETHKEASDDA